MASFSKASQGVLRALKPWLGIPESLTGHDGDDSDDSIWRRPSTETTLVGSEASAGSNPSGLKQHHSATDTDYKGWSRSLRSLAAHFYAEENTKPSVPLDDSVPKTPEKRLRQSPRKPLPWSRSSIRSRGANPRNFLAKGTSVFDDGDPEPKSIAQTTAPVLNVAIPKFNLAVDTEDQSPLAGESRMKAYKSNQSRTLELLAQRAENHPASPLTKQESEEVLPTIGWKFPVAGNPNDAYHELLQGPRGSSELNVGAKASSSNDSDVEDNDEDEEYGGAGLLELHAAAAKSKNFLTPDSHTEKPSSGEASGESTHRTIPLSHYLKTPSPPSKARSTLHRSQSIRKGLHRLQHTLTGSFKSRPGLRPRVPSYASDADAENSEGSPPCPSMGSRHEWQARRIDRNRRYAEAVADRPPTEDDSESGESLRLSRSPTRKPTDQKGNNLTVAHDMGRRSDTGNLRYAVEANERRNAEELSVRNLRYAIEAIDRPSATELEEDGDTRAGERRMIPLPDPQDPYEAALVAAGLQPERRQSWIPTLESLCEHDDTTAAAAAGARSIASVAVRLDTVHGHYIGKHEGPLDTGMWALKHIRGKSEDELKVFNSPESPSEEVGVDGSAVDYFGHEQIGLMEHSSHKKAGDGTQARHKIFVDGGASACESNGDSSEDDTISID